MAIFTEFEYFDIDGSLIPFLFIFSDGNRATVFSPAGATFISPPLTGGDTFDIYSALIGQEASIQIEILNEGVGNIVEEGVRRACIVDMYWEDEAPGDIETATVYPGNPPRYKFGAFTESVNGVITRYDHLTYRRQAVGRRLILLDRDLTKPVWGNHPDVSNQGLGRYRHDEYLWGIDHCHKLHLHLDEGVTYDENEGEVPPLPPQIVPLKFRVQGRLYFDFSATLTYDHPSDGRRAARDGTYLPREAGPYGVGWQGGTGSFPI